MSTCILCDGWIKPGEKVSREVRGMLKPNKKMALMDETGREAHWVCVEALMLDGIAWKEQRLDMGVESEQ